MISPDFLFIIRWWLLLFMIGSSCLPLILLLFPAFFDKGYIFAKVIGIILLSYGTLVLGELHIIFFSTINVLILLIIIAIANLMLLLKNASLLFALKSAWKFFLLEEIMFFLGLWYWSWIRGTAPDIHGLEKFMDFGFVNSILRSSYFPPNDMWYPPFSINYYYFGHFATAVLTKASMIPSNISFNIMLATLFTLTLTCSFSLGANFLQLLFKKHLEEKHKKSIYEKSELLERRQIIHPSKTSPIEEKLFWNKKATIWTAIGGLLTAYLMTFAGNLHTIYTFFKPYENENPVPFWKLPFFSSTFPNNYWYPNATRFIYHTIHEFPIYSFVVSDLHGHVLDIPFVLLTIAILFGFFIHYQTRTSSHKLFITIALGFLIAVMYMTNAWDGIIYFLLTMAVTLFLTAQAEIQYTHKRISQIIFKKNYVIDNAYYIAITFISFIFFSLPFSLFFKPFASQIGILCAPKFLTNIGHFGPFLFEVDHCQHSPLYQLLILHGFPLFWIAGFIVFLFLQRKKRKPYPTDIFVMLLFLISILLIIIPEFIYLKDIYPAHYRANTMFKLVYQSFIILSLCSGYCIMRLLLFIGKKTVGIKTAILYIIFYFPLGALLLILVAIYPYFAINAYYDNLQKYYGLDGTKYLQRLYPADYDTILWLNKNITGQPVILEAQGDSYTDYARISANTGLPTPLGWTVHEWLWRGSYNSLPERITDMQTLYETTDITVAKSLAKKYTISLVYVGDMERKKYTNIHEEKFLNFGKIIFQEGSTKVYRIHP